MRRLGRSTSSRVRYRIVAERAAWTAARATISRCAEFAAACSTARISSYVNGIRPGSTRSAFNRVMGLAKIRRRFLANRCEATEEERQCTWRRENWLWRTLREVWCCTGGYGRTAAHPNREAGVQAHLVARPVLSGCPRSSSGRRADQPFTQSAPEPENCSSASGGLEPPSTGSIAARARCRPVGHCRGWCW
jgi:hypothetical protein